MFVLSAELGDEPVAGRDALVVRRLAGAGSAVRSGRDARLPDGSQVSHEDQQRASRGALQPGHGAHWHGDRVRHSHQGVRTVAKRRRAENGVRGPPVQGRCGADQRSVRAHLQGTNRRFFLPFSYCVFFSVGFRPSTLFDDKRREHNISLSLSWNHVQNIL